MATLEQHRPGEYRLRFMMGRRRCSVHLSGMDSAAASIAKQHVEHLVHQHKLDRPPSAKTSRWLETLDDSVYERLGSLDLVEPHQVIDAPRKVCAYCTHYIDSRTDWAKPQNYRQSVNHLRNFLRRDVALSRLTKGDCESFHRWMMHNAEGPKLSANTAGQHIKRLRHIFAHAIDCDLIDRNPFAGIKINLESDATKDHFVSRSDADAMLEQCPDQEWRVVFVLCRYGGLRCPSEVLQVQCGHIAWDRNRFKVISPKTKRYGKQERIVPLFPEVRTELEALQELSAESRYVIKRYRDSENNLRTLFNKICDRAGVARFPKPFMNLRQSRRNEMELEGVRTAALDAWFGHSSKVAAKHYSKVNDADYERDLELGATSGAFPETAQERDRQASDAK